MMKTVEQKGPSPIHALPKNGSGSVCKDSVLEGASYYLIPGRIAALKEFGIPVVVDRREGYRFWDLDGRELMDFHLNGGTFNVGHRNPEIMQCLADAMETLDIGNHHFASPSRVELAERLAALTPGELRYSVFTSSGSEAVDVAIKSARYATGRRAIVAFDIAYHGRTGLSGAAGDDSAARFFLSDQPNSFVKVPFNDLDALRATLKKHDVAAVLMETIPATYGFPVPDDDFVQGVRDACDEAGALLIADEVQTGLGRTGNVWAVDYWNVEPDILVTAKGLSGGIYPIAAAVLSERVGQWLSENPWGHVSTFGGSELGCIVASRVLDISCSPESLKSIRHIADFIGDGLRDVQSRKPYLMEVRQSGLVIGLKFDDPEGGIRMARSLYENGIWAMFAGFDASCLQFKPGLFVDEAYCSEALERFETAISAATKNTTRIDSGTINLRNER